MAARGAIPCKASDNLHRRAGQIGRLIGGSRTWISGSLKLLAVVQVPVRKAVLFEAIILSMSAFLTI